MSPVPFLFLLMAAILEVGGDAFIRHGLHKNTWWPFAAGAFVLFAYGVFVNLPKWNFSRLMGVYIALFFLVAQIVSVVIFKEKIALPTFVGGALIIAGGLLMTLWKPA
jgi:multidrug transporter EmrE-like cation transporter